MAQGVPAELAVPRNAAIVLASTVHAVGTASKCSATGMSGGLAGTRGKSKPQLRRGRAAKCGHSSSEHFSCRGNGVEMLGDGKEAAHFLRRQIPGADSTAGRSRDPSHKATDFRKLRRS